MTGSRRSSRAALCRLSCWFVSSGANARWAQVGGALRKYSAHVGAEASSRRPGVAPITPSAGGNVSTFPPRASVSLPPAEGVIALWEVDEMARTRLPLPNPAGPAARRPISETCPPGEGALLCSWDGPLNCQALKINACGVW